MVVGVVQYVEPVFHIYNYTTLTYGRGLRA